MKFATPFLERRAHARARKAIEDALDAHGSEHPATLAAHGRWLAITGESPSANRDERVAYRRADGEAGYHNRHQRKRLRRWLAVEQRAAAVGS